MVTRRRGSGVDAPDEKPGLALKARTSRRRRSCIVAAVSIREQTDEERRQYDDAVRSALVAIMNQLEDRKENPK